MQRLLPPTLVLTLLAFMALATLLLPGPSIVPGMWRLVGAVIAGAGVALNLIGAGLFAKVDTNIKTFNEPDKLVSSGVFARTRNPMYVGFLLLLIGAAAASGELVPWLGPLAFFLAANQWYIPFEEERMSSHFGSSYECYRSLVPRWVGRQSIRRQSVRRQQIGVES